jgi:hypothetical protein
VRDVRIGAILQANQPGIHKQFNKNHKRDRKGRRGCKKHLSFSDIDRLMRERTDIDERKCQGR